MPERKEAIDFPVPFPVELFYLLAVASLDGVPTQHFPERLDGDPSITGQRQARMLVRVKVQDVDVDETDAVPLKDSLRGCGEVRPAGPNPDDEVGVARHAVGGKRA